MIIHKEVIENGETEVVEHATIPLSIKQIEQNKYEIQLYNVNYPGRVETAMVNTYSKTFEYEDYTSAYLIDVTEAIDFGEGKKSIYALEGTEVLVQRNKEVQMAAHDFGKGRAVYISGVPYSFANSRTLYRAILWSAHSEDELHTWFSSNYNVEVHAYVKNGKYCVVNNTYEPQDTTVYTTDGNSFDLHLDANEIRWYEI